MRAVDTNVLARFVVRDDPEQARLASEVIAAGAFVPLTVMLELAWLLRSRIKLHKSALVDAIETILSIETLVVEKASLLRWALLRSGGGPVLADLIHVVAASGTATSLITFDPGIARAAGATPPLLVETLGA